jgi:hypothetical protein
VCLVIKGLRDGSVKEPDALHSTTEL